ncbi:Eco57I restriction-modification methylase domain-containing protein [Mucilaginibacter sp. NFR10]|uniref:Eco57I restriction-modification methylase domain-containing protein n=1 Tax=Mucilaginibacter sp. NFR10 TaxID=1566292 RepID=UPI00087172B9|nr:TaqI-like C-terminal specificity domain-containing protein [Mucilaginibacter sp. NFR10]SCW71956.1 Eco57I restriction-modification methylase [Mucilaginibacter sp. NFR10]
MLNSEQLKPILEAKYNRNDWYKILRQNFNVDTLRENPIIKVSVTQNDFGAVAYELGTFDTSNGHVVGIYEVDVPAVKQIYRNKVGLRNLLSNVYKTDVDAALIVFTQGDKWRFSYVSEVTARNSVTGEREKLKTDPKRYTYLFGKDEKAKTAADRFADIQKEDVATGRGITLKSLQDTFNVEKMSKEFFDKYRKHYGAFLTYLIGENEEGKVTGEATHLFKTAFNADRKKARDFVKKMLGRIVFLYFLEKKGWLGVPADEPWGKGDPDFLRNLFDNSKDQEGFYSLVLEPLFHNTLNKMRAGDFFAIDDTLFNGIEYSKCKIPFLNGGLFEPEAYITDYLIFPAELFKNLFTFFDRYNFTVHEDSPQEHTVAVDPEMLGHIFENLLEDNKDKGAFYTPKEIVHYMCQESLIEYLCTKCEAKSDENLRIGIEGFIKNQELGGIAEYDEIILQALRDVKICDPAIGSGAFPMGVLLEIFHSVETLYYEFDATKRIWDLEDGWNPAKVKLSIIENSIYGVDIEPGAVDIARLRFWLSLVVDELKPQPLPNLDYKIVVGNSLLSKFEDEVIDIDWEVNAGTEATKKLQLQIQENLRKLLAKQKQFFNYKGDKKKIQAEIRSIKIDVLISQLELDKYKYDHTTAKTGNLFGETKNEKVKTTEIALQLAGYTTSIKKLEALKLQSEKPLNFFDWKLDFPEVLNPMLKEKGSLTSTGGFNIVIGNPPYVKVQNLDYQEIDLYKQRYLVAYKRLDISSLFFELIERLITVNGNCFYISSNQFLMAEYGRNLRNFLTTKLWIKSCIDFGGLPVFESAITYVSIFNLTKRENVLLNYNKVSHLPFDQSEIHYEKIDYANLNAEKWIMSSGNKELLISKLNNKFEKLKKYAKCSYGIVSGADKVFIMNEDQIRTHGIEKECLLPLLRANDCDRYSIIKNHLYILYPFELIGKQTVLLGLNTIRTKYPATFKYLMSNEHILKKRKDSRETFENIENWHTLTRFGQLEVFSQNEKIVFPGEQRAMKFGLNMNKAGYSGARVFGITLKLNNIDLRYFLAILNSKLIEFFVHHTFPLKQGDYYSMSSTMVDNLPMIVSQQASKIVKLAKEVILKKQEKLDTKILEEQINCFVYKIYSLTFDEVCIIDPQFSLNETEYNNLIID